MRKILTTLIIIVFSLSSFSQIIRDHHIIPFPREVGNTKLIINSSCSTLCYGADSFNVEIIDYGYFNTLLIYGFYPCPSAATAPSNMIDTFDLSSYVTDETLKLKFYINYTADSIEQCIRVFTFSKTPINIYDNSIKIYPNPTSGFTTITADNIQQIELLNINGQLLEEYTINNKSYILDMNNRKKGIYFIKVKTDKGAVTEKIIVE